MAGGTGYNANNEIFHSDRCFVYDVIRDTWCSAQNLPHDSNTFGMEAVGNKVYLTTGSDGSAYISSEEGNKTIFIHVGPIVCPKLFHFKISIMS